MTDELRRFARQVQPIYALMNWRWTEDDDVTKSVPSVDRIEQRVRELVDAVTNEETTWVRTGRLVVERDGTGVNLLLDVGGWDEFGQFYFPDGTYRTLWPDDAPDEEFDYEEEVGV